MPQEIDLPEDYDACGECEYDHRYQPNEAERWHQDNPCSGCVYDMTHGHGQNCPVALYPS
jgi:hypothetical protein